MSEDDVRALLNATRTVGEGTGLAEAAELVTALALATADVIDRHLLMTVAQQLAARARERKEQAELFMAKLRSGAFGRGDEETS